MDRAALDQTAARFAIFGRNPTDEAIVGQIRYERFAVIRLPNLAECIVELFRILRIPPLPQALGKTTRTSPCPQVRILLVDAELKRAFQGFQRTLRIGPR